MGDFKHIYHYTNIETLALILKNKTIRFNRLDRVDDISEGESFERQVGISPIISEHT